jgi:hypothetical protein
VEDLRVLLEGSMDLKETTLLDFFGDRPDLIALIGTYNPENLRLDRIAREYTLFGDFRCDFAIGDSKRRAYTFVEFENADRQSLFVRPRNKKTSEWSPRFEHGYSQVVDWFYKLHVMADTPDMEARLGMRSIDFTGVLIVGRDGHMDASEKLRLKWRRDYTIVNSKRIVCVTFDQLLDDLTFRLDGYPLASRSGG